MSDVDWKKEHEERLQALGLRPAPDRRLRCIHCGAPFDAVFAAAHGSGLCDDCLHAD